MRLIDADKLPEHKFTRESAKGSDYMRGWNDAIDAIGDNEPTVERPIKGLAKMDDNGEVIIELLRPRGEWIVDQSPSYTGLYMVSIDSLVTVANFDGKIFRSRNDVPLAIDAWRPLPKPYKEAEND